MEASAIHQETALLSDTLADFAPDDLAGRKATVDKILVLREQWKDKMYLAETGEVRRPPAKESVLKPTEIRLGLTEAEIILEMKKTSVNISKYRQKIGERPDHKKIEEWQAELDRLLVIQANYDTELRRLKYETAQ